MSLLHPELWSRLIETGPMRQASMRATRDDCLSIATRQKRFGPRLDLVSVSSFEAVSSKPADLQPLREG